MYNIGNTWYNVSRLFYFNPLTGVSVDGTVLMECITLTEVFYAIIC